MKLKRASHQHDHQTQPIDAAALSERIVQLTLRGEITWKNAFGLYYADHEGMELSADCWGLSTFRITVSINGQRHRLPVSFSQGQIKAVRRAARIQMLAKRWGIDQLQDQDPQSMSRAKLKAQRRQARAERRQTRHIRERTLAIEADQVQTKALQALMGNEERPPTPQQEQFIQAVEEFMTGEVR